jgi:hypothetical protein
MKQEKAEKGMTRRNNRISEAIVFFITVSL